MQRNHMFLVISCTVSRYISGTWGSPSELLMPIQIRFNESLPDEFQIAIFIYLVLYTFVATRVFSYVELDDLIVKSTGRSEHIWTV